MKARAHSHGIAVHHGARFGAGRGAKRRVSENVGGKYTWVMDNMDYKNSLACKKKRASNNNRKNFRHNCTIIELAARVWLWCN